jgi:DNA-binding GntR family transcriptional regulator
MNRIKKIEAPQNLTALAYASIKAYILRENLDENTRLIEEFLSRQLGISKSPVREALNSLHTEGLIRIESRRGAYLRRFSTQEVKDLYDLREALEVYAVGSAVLSAQMISELRQSTERARKHLRSNNRLGHIEEDTKFHALIAAATGNAKLCRVLQMSRASFGYAGAKPTIFPLRRWWMRTKPSPRHWKREIGGAPRRPCETTSIWCGDA